jgi:hypothetical protein
VTYIPVQIEHGSDSIEPKAVDTVLLNVPSEIRKKKAKHLPLGEIKDLRIPQLMLTLCVYEREWVREGEGGGGRKKDE